MINDSILIVVDMLHDFIDGSLACANADKAVDNTLEFIKKTRKDDLPVFFIRDHHPADHSSFKEHGGIWPSHCVAGTRGGEIDEKLQPYVDEDLVFDKGCDKTVEQYSGFDGRNSAGQSLAEVTGMLEPKDVYVCGIATEYCVRNTCEDLMKAGFNVVLLGDCLAYVDEKGHREALEAMRSEGITVR
ncbi:MAG: cysteine hydrolase family protein [Candidatus Cryptobacteroides sp.]